MAQKAPQAPMNRRTTYQAGGARSTGKGSVVTTGGGGSRVTINPGSSKGATRQLPGSSSSTGSSSPAARRSPASGRGSSSSGGKGKRQRRIPGTPRSGGQGGGPSYHNYQAIILAEFVAAELLVAATPIATRKNQPGLSPYVPKDLVKLISIGLVYFILELTATGGRGTGRIGAWFGGLILIVVGLNEATSLAKVFEVLSGGSGKPAKIETTAAQPSAFAQAMSGAPPLGVAAAASSGGGGGSGPHSGSAFVAEAAKFIGDPYVFGAAGPTAFDCSGLVWYALSKLGIHAPRTSEEQWGWVQRISRSQLQPGDLIFEQWPGEASPGHVAIYSGNGQIIQAPAPGENVQQVPWSPSIVHGQGGQIVGYGRVPGLSYGATGPPAPVM